MSMTQQVMSQRIFIHLGPAAQIEIRRPSVGSFLSILSKGASLDQKFFALSKGHQVHRQLKVASLLSR